MDNALNRKYQSSSISLSLGLSDKIELTEPSDTEVRMMNCMSLELTDGIIYSNLVRDSSVMGSQLPDRLRLIHSPLYIDLVRLSVAQDKEKLLSYLIGLKLPIFSEFRELEPIIQSVLPFDIESFHQNEALGGLIRHCHQVLVPVQHKVLKYANFTGQFELFKFRVEVAGYKVSHFDTDFSRFGFKHFSGQIVEDTISHNDSQTLDYILNAYPSSRAEVNAWLSLSLKQLKMNSFKTLMKHPNLNIDMGLSQKDNVLSTMLSLFEFYANTNSYTKKALVEVMKIFLKHPNAVAQVIVCCFIGAALDSDNRETIDLFLEEESSKEIKFYLECIENAMKMKKYLMVDYLISKHSFEQTLFYEKLILLFLDIRLHINPRSVDKLEQMLRLTKALESGDANPLLIDFNQLLQLDESVIFEVVHMSEEHFGLFQQKMLCIIKSLEIALVTHQHNSKALEKIEMYKTKLQEQVLTVCQDLLPEIQSRYISRRNLVCYKEGITLPDTLSQNGRPKSNLRQTYLARLPEEILDCILLESVLPVNTPKPIVTWYMSSINDMDERQRVAVNAINLPFPDKHPF